MDKRSLVFGKLLYMFAMWNTGLFKMTVGVLTTCHTQYTCNSSICVFFYLIEQHSKFLWRTLEVLYMCTLCDSTNINTKIEFVCSMSALVVSMAVLIRTFSSGRNAYLLHTAHHKRKLWEFLDPSVYDKLLKPRQSFLITLFSDLHIFDQFVTENCFNRVWIVIETLKCFKCWSNIFSGCVT